MSFAGQSKAASGRRTPKTFRSDGATTDSLALKFPAGGAKITADRHDKAVPMNLMNREEL